MSNFENTSFEILLKISQELAGSLDLHTVLKRVLTLSTTNIGAERASLVVLDKESNALDAAIILNGELIDSTVEQMQEVITSGLAGWVIRNKQPALLADTQKDDRWLARPMINQTLPAGKSALCLPVMARDDLVGVLTIVKSQTNYFTQEHLALMQAIADMAGIAINNARLYEEIQHARKRYYDLFEESVDPILVTDLKGHVLEANRQAVAVSGYAIDELQHCSIRDLHTVTDEKIGANYELIPFEGSRSYESDLVQKNRDMTPIEVHVSQINVSGSQCIQWIFRDLKERKALDKLREDLSAMIYHDLRAPLANIISSLEIMSTMLSSESSSSFISLFEIADRSTERMQRLLSGLLDINRLESGQEITTRKRTSIQKVIVDSIETIGSSAHTKNIQVENDVEAGLPEVMVDEDMIRRVMLNLLENATKFSPNGSTVHIGAKQNDGFVFVWVDDQGAGIPEKAKERIFDKFVQVHGENSIKGLGLGLAFCRLAVQAHGGTIWVENLPQGGSRFIFTLPD
jgi:two-component system, NtrC family, sensor histidine kinase KinB